jgi:hypothetical protein
VRYSGSRYTCVRPHIALIVARGAAHALARGLAQDLGVDSVSLHVGAAGGNGRFMPRMRVRTAHGPVKYRQNGVFDNGQSFSFVVASLVKCTMILKLPYYDDRGLSRQNTTLRQRFCVAPAPLSSDQRYFF